LYFQKVSRLHRRIRAATALFLLVALLASLALTTGCAKTGGGITVAGSTSVQPFAEILAERYMTLYPDRVVNVQGGGSSAGIKAVLSGATDIGMSSRELTATEKRLTEHAIALDVG
jgi:phosphate transport system substrate-binding protein